MSTQRRSEPHPFVSYADASHICKHCDGGELAACHQTNTIRQQSRAVRNMPSLNACTSCGLHYYQTSAPHVCAGWTTKEKVMSTTIEKPCGDCFNKSHTHQIVDYPLGTRVEAVIDIPIYQGTIRSGTKGTVGSHCEDGRAYVFFDGNTVGHTFHQPEAYIRVIDRSEGDWCDDCHGYTHMPWCPSFEPPESESHQTCPEGVNAIDAGSRTEHEPVARGGEGKWQRRDSEVFIHRQMTPDELVAARAKGFKTTDIRYTVARFYGDDAEENAQTAIESVNQHHSLLAEREKYAQLLQAARNLIAMNNCNYDRAVMRSEGGFDALQKAVDAIDQKGGEG